MKKPETMGGTAPVHRNILAEEAKSIANLSQALNQFLKGKDSVTETVLCALFSGGHVLFEDVPGVGKTTVIKALSKMLGLQLARIQCTSDLLPSDILGVEVYSSKTDAFVFHQGPIFAPIVFVDELNRCSPRTQSALLEAMAEGVVTVSRKTYALPKPFIVFATQNPSDSIGTYPLPESQLDRFSAKLHLLYPERGRELEILSASDANPIDRVSSNLLDPAVLLSIQQAVDSVHLSERVVQYVYRVVEATRHHENLKLGVSTRGAVSWLRMARGRAILNGRDYVIPDDLILIAPSCLAHRLLTRGGSPAEPILQEILAKIPIE